MEYRQEGFAIEAAGNLGDPDRILGHLEMARFKRNLGWQVLAEEERGPVFPQFLPTEGMDSDLSEHGIHR